jgi:hypothetical protein
MSSKRLFLIAINAKPLSLSSFDEGSVVSIFFPFRKIGA